ncbi:hypothetical protein [Aureimonas mangrovi]|uniref:hypothetical protein n=1 Tax=Aureimonas mangrovi TaxID=2758041 RepID=UPI00163D8F9B|nr:hypothetical protein [Aureimonas mangrovi]
MTGWTRELVLEELIRACEVYDALPIRTGPQAYGSTMPPILREVKDEFTAGGRAKANDNDAKARAVLRRARATAADISRADQALAWVPAFVPTPDLREVLMRHAVVRARGWDWDRAVSARNRRNPAKKGWVRRTTYRWIARACQGIADALDHKGIPLPADLDGQVSHEPAETTSNLIRSGSLRGWRQAS